MARNYLEPARSIEHREEFTEVILLQPQRAQRWIALGNRGPRNTKACSAASGGMLLERVSPQHMDAIVQHSCVSVEQWMGSEPVAEEEVELFHEDAGLM